MSSEVASIHYHKDQIVCSAGEKTNDLYVIEKGHLLVFVNNGTEITPISYLGQGEFLGEISFFDQLPRSAHVICLEDSTLIKVSKTDLKKVMPEWLITIAKSLATRLRHTDELIRQKGLKRKGAKTMSPLSTEQQKAIYSILTKHLAQ